MNPFLINGPAVISFSGGRTSGLMLHRVLEAGLQPDVHVLFANTGKERPETLEFVRDCAQHFATNVRWVERRRGDGESPSYAEVDFASANRDGALFESLLIERSFLPNPVTRFCTTELKIRVMKAFMLEQGYEHWTNVVGLRVDEPGRVAKQRAKEGKERWDLSFPLFDAGITKNDVLLFWKKQTFDLQLRSWEGNCDLCYLKGVAKRTRIIEDRPDLAEWWIRQEARQEARFRDDTPAYRALLAATQKQHRMFGNELFDEAALDDDPTQLDECGGYCESNVEAA